MPPKLFHVERCPSRCHPLVLRQCLARVLQARGENCLGRLPVCTLICGWTEAGASRPRPCNLERYSRRAELLPRASARPRRLNPATRRQLQGSHGPIQNRTPRPGVPAPTRRLRRPVSPLLSPPAALAVLQVPLPALQSTSSVDPNLGVDACVLVGPVAEKPFGLELETVDAEAPLPRASFSHAVWSCGPDASPVRAGDGAQTAAERLGDLGADG